jgi:UDP-3-O-[3-hydroxymyristoyl] glucosamine N-acyltransferase
MLLSELATRIGCRLEIGRGGTGRGAAQAGAVRIERVAGLEDARPGDVTFLANRKYARHVASTRASAVIADASLVSAPCPILRSAHPYVAFADAVRLLNPPPAAVAGVHPLASVDPSATISDAASIAAFVSIGAGARVGARSILHPHVVVGAGAVIGDDCVIHAHASIREGVVLGNRVILQDAAVVGSDGFGFAKRSDGSHQKIPQVGGVVIEDDVEIGAHSAVDRPAVGETRIAAGTKIDNLVQIAHGVQIGQRVLLAAQVGIAGSTVIDDDAVFAGQSGAVGHVHVGKGVIVTAKSGVTHDLKPGQMVSGFPAFDLTEWKKASVEFRRLGRPRPRAVPKARPKGRRRGKR